jgi:hypothetical protein
VDARRLPLTALLVGVALAGGCGTKKQRSDRRSDVEPPAPSAGGLSPQEIERETKRRQWAQAKEQDGNRRRRVAVAIEESELASLVPAIPGATIIAPVAQDDTGRGAKASLCVTAGDAEAAGHQIRGAFQAAGWGELYSRPHRTIPGRLGVSGQNAPFRLTGTIASGEQPGCAAADGKVFVELTFHKLLTPDQAKAP